jgi:hypothetical protein
MMNKTKESIAHDRADWLVDAVATSTQNRALLRGDPEEDEWLTEAIYLNAKKAILVAFDKLEAEEK